MAHEYWYSILYNHTWGFFIDLFNFSISDRIWFWAKIDRLRYSTINVWISSWNVILMNFGVLDTKIEFWRNRRGKKSVIIVATISLKSLCQNNRFLGKVGRRCQELHSLAQSYKVLWINWCEPNCITILTNSLKTFWCHTIDVLYTERY